MFIFSFSPDLYLKNRSLLERPTSAKRRPDHALKRQSGLGDTLWSQNQWQPGLGDTLPHKDKWQPGLGDTLRANDIDNYFGRKTPTSSLDAVNRKTAHFQNDDYNDDDVDHEIASTLINKQHTTGDRHMIATKESLFGRKTPTRESPLTKELSKEEIIFGRKTPTQ